MIYRLLGDLEIDAGGSPLPLPSGHHLIVLSALLINANQRIAKRRLLRSGWGGSEVGEPQLPKAIKALRDLLAQIGRRGDIVTHQGFGYELRVADEDLDMLLFRRLIRQVPTPAGHPADDEIARLHAALALWRGPRALANLPGNPFAEAVEVLAQARKRAAARLFDLEMTRGGHDRILDELAMMADNYPADRRLCEQLMITLHRLGHSADAIDAYQRHARAVAEHAGGKPDALLRDYQYAIAGDGGVAAVAAAEAALAARAGTAGRAVAKPTAVPRQLPPEPADFVGRDQLVAEAAWLLGRPPAAAPPVAVISGAGGMGKTALARLVAHRVSARYPDGQLYVELRGAAGSAAETLGQLLRALGCPAVPESTAERLATYRTLLATRRVLIVLDDAVDGAQIRDLVPGGVGCGVLVTARTRLPELAGAHHLPPLEALSPAVGTALFVRSVAAGGIELTGEDDAVREVVKLCHGLPLALRVAAAQRVRDHPRPTAELAERLRRQGPEGLQYGQESVVRTIGAGYDRLSDEARQLFLALGLLRIPGFGLWTAFALLGGGGSDPARVLAQLSASNMLEVRPAELRYRFHDLTREYALRRATAEGVGKGAPERAYRALLTLARRAHAAIYGGAFEVVHSEVADWIGPPEALAEVDADPLDWFERERLNVRAAVEHCAELGLADLCWDLAVSTHEFYTLRGYFDDWLATHTVALRACRRAGDRRGEGVLLACLGQPTLVASAPAGGISGPAELRRAVALLHESGDRHGQAIARRTLANALRRQARLAEPLRLFQEALDDYTAAGDAVGRWQTLRYIGHTHLDLGDVGNALADLRTAERVAIELGDTRLRAQSRYWIGQALLLADDPTTAQTAFDEVLAAFPGPNGLGHAYALHGLGDLAACSGDWDRAEACLARADTLARDAVDTVLEGRVCLSRAAVAAARDGHGEQAALLERAARRFAECGAAQLEVRAVAVLARARASLGDQAGARDAWERVRRSYDELGVPETDRIESEFAGELLRRRWSRRA